MLMKEWEIILKNDDVKVWAVQPGLLAAGQGGYSQDVIKAVGAMDPTKGADFVVSVVEGAVDKDVRKLVAGQGRASCLGRTIFRYQPYCTAERK